MTSTHVRTIEDRFTIRYVTGISESDCWEWVATRMPKGYGYMSAFGHTELAHRISVFLASGRMPTKEEVVRHTCDNPPCVNPAHLLVGTQSENVADMKERGRGRWAAGAQSANGKKTHCPHGHEYTLGNTYYDRLNNRHCRECRREVDRRRSKTKKR